MEAVVTNCWSRITRSEPGRAPQSLVVVELSVPPPRHLLRGAGPQAVELLLPGFRCNFPPGRIWLRDGVVGAVDVAETASGVRVRVVLERPAPHAPLLVHGGTPAQLVLEFDRTAATKALARAVVVLDPGHGGGDAGYRGPVNLWEKDKALELAELAADLLREAGSTPVLTRRGDRTTSKSARRDVAVAARADLCISVHLGGGDGTARGCRATYPFGERRSRALAESLYASLVERVPLPGRGVRPVRAERDVLLPAPWACLEPLSIAHPLDEALLRDPHFKRRVARAMVLGTAAFLERIGEEAGSGVTSAAART